MAKSKTQYINLQGRAYWTHRLFVPDDFNGDRKWSVSLYLEGSELEKFEGIGLSLQPVGSGRSKTKPELPDPWKGFRFTRPCEKDFGKGPEELEAPKVLDKDNKPFPEDKRIGNGSLVEINISVYGDRIKGHRLNSVKVLELVEYESPVRVEEAPKTVVSPKTKTPW